MQKFSARDFFIDNLLVNSACDSLRAIYSSSFLLSGLELRDAKIYEPALLGTASHFCIVVVQQHGTSAALDVAACVLPECVLDMGERFVSDTS